MDEKNLLAGQFEANRTHLQSVAYRMLGSKGEADDAVQEAWIRLSRSDASGIGNLRGWLTTAVARIALDMLRARTSRREEPLEAPSGQAASEPIAGNSEAPDHDMLLADSLGIALLVVLETLDPAARVAFVLHDMFDMPFDEIAPIVGRTPAGARQLASRARRRVRGVSLADEGNRAHRRKIVDAFLAASRENDFAALLAVLDPEVVLHADAVAVDVSIARRAHGAPVLAPEIRGAEAVARAFAGRAGTARPALVDGAPGLVWAPGGVVRAVFAFSVIGERIVAIDLIGSPARIGELDITIDAA